MPQAIACLGFDGTCAEKVFDALAAGGRVTMPMSPAFWAKTFGRLTDRFGTPWIVNGEMPTM